MKVEVLVSAMHKNDFLIVDEMKINTDAIIINQSDKLCNEEKKINGNTIRINSNRDIGVGKSRNSALMNSNGDICVIADEDMIYTDGYESIIINEFKKNPKADMIIFNIESLNIKRPTIKIKKRKKVNYFNFMRYGACRIAFKREVVLKNNIFFSLLFGGGAKYGSGEDTIFISDCLKSGMNIYTSPIKLADVKQEESCWYTGINEKLYRDKGALFAAMSKKKAKLLAIIFSIKWYGQYKEYFKYIDVLKYMNEGIKNYNDSSGKI